MDFTHIQAFGVLPETRLAQAYRGPKPVFRAAGAL